MKLYLDTKKMTFNEEENKIEHEIIISIFEKDFIGCDYSINLSANSQFIKDTLKIDKIGKDNKEIRQFKVRANGWDAFPLYELKNKKIISFDYTKYSYFANTNRRVSLGLKINDLYNPSSELKTLRKTLKYIMETLGIEYPDFFDKYNTKVGKIIEKNPK